MHLLTLRVNIDADSGRSTKNSGIVNDFIPNFTAYFQNDFCYEYSKRFEFLQVYAKNNEFLCYFFICNFLCLTLLLLKMHVPCALCFFTY
jgi:hypothetical protein